MIESNDLNNAFSENMDSLCPGKYAAETSDSQPNPDEIAISVQNLSKKYHLYGSPQDRLKEALHPFRKKYFHEFWALKDLSFDVRKGDTIGVIGHNGSGKSTLLKVVAGVLTPTTGSVKVNGRIAALLELGSGFNPELTGRENVYLNGAFLGIDRIEMEEVFPAIEQFAGIGEFIDQPVKTYSSGMFVRLAFSVSVCVEPDILIVDEALSVGDAAFQFKCMNRLDKITKSGTTLLFVSHDMGAIKTFCNHVIYLKNGTERASGTPDQMSELYLLDMRDEQVRDLGHQSSVRAKKFIGCSTGIAFGNDQGRVVMARFQNTGGLDSSFISGDRIDIEVEVEYFESVQNPSLTIAIYDRKMILIYSLHTSISGSKTNHNKYCSNILSSFKALLGGGRYFVTVQLNDRPSDRVFFPIDKQVGVLSFEILQPSTMTFLGTADLSMLFSEVKG